MVHLPSNASPISHQRAQLMYEFVRNCPPELGQEIFLYCSVAKGYADKFSDIEVTFLVDDLQEPSVYEQWLACAGAKVDSATIEWGGGFTTKSWIDGIFIEAAWRPFSALHEMVDLVCEASTIDHWKLVDAWHTLHAVPLTKAPQLTSWQQTLSIYPDSLQSKLITDARQHLTEPHWYPLSIVNSFPLAFRGVPMELSGHLMWTVERSLRILFAINEQWEPDYKWLQHEANRLEVKPSYLVQQVNDTFMLPSLQERVLTCFQLLLDVLNLVPDQFNMTKEIEHISEAMNPEILLEQKYGV